MVVGAERVGGARPVEAALGAVDVGGTDGGADVLRRQPVRGQPRGVGGRGVESVAGQAPASGRVVAGRGGSWWCSQSTCHSFNLVDIGHMDRHGSLANQGFRIAFDLPARGVGKTGDRDIKKAGKH